LFRYVPRQGLDQPQVLLVHPGGPYFWKKDLGVWSIPKGEIHPGEDPLDAARRELFEETGCRAPGPFLPLYPIRQNSGKVVHAWACESDFDCASLASNEFEMEWPPRSNKLARFPEVDRAEWFGIQEARVKMNQGQTALLDQLLTLLASR
jgi:predicted NUDIX family NTP pyrophosphohydrolase